MRVGISCYPTFGGSGAVATAIGYELAARGHEAHFISYAKPAKLNTNLKNIFFHEVTTTTYPLFKYPPYPLDLAAKMLAMENKIDIFHMHYAIPHALSAFLYKSISPHPRPFIVTLHGTDITLVRDNPHYARIVKLGLKEAAAVTSVSHYLKNVTHETFGRELEIQVIYNFVQQNLLCFEEKTVCHECLEKFNIPRGVPLLVHISNFRPVKRVFDVIRTFDLILKKMDARLMMAGEGPDLEHARDLARDLGILGKILFLGNLTCLLPVLSLNNTVFLFPSEEESFGLAALEALYQGIPVIASQSGGIPEVVVHGENGYLIKIGDIQSMADYSVRLLSQPDLYQSFSKQGRLRATRFFDKNISMQQYLDLYEKFLS